MENMQNDKMSATNPWGSQRIEWLQWYLATTLLHAANWKLLIPIVQPSRASTKVIQDFSQRTPSLLNCTTSAEDPVRCSFRTPTHPLCTPNVAAAEGPRFEEQTAQAFNVGNTAGVEVHVQSAVHAGSEKEFREDEEPMPQELSRSDQAGRLKIKSKVCEMYFVTPLLT